MLYPLALLEEKERPASRRRQEQREREDAHSVLDHRRVRPLAQSLRGNARFAQEKPRKFKRRQRAPSRHACRQKLQGLRMTIRTENQKDRGLPSVDRARGLHRSCRSRRPPPRPRQPPLLPAPPALTRRIWSPIHTCSKSKLSFKQTELPEGGQKRWGGEGRHAYPSRGFPGFLLHT